VSWDADVRPDGFVDEMVFQVVGNSGEPVSMVGSGEVDYADSVGINTDAARQFAIQYPDQWHSAAAGTHYVVMNTSMAPFDNVDARRAVSFAIDRARMMELLPGPQGAAVTCQLLPPGYPGYEPYCPYTENPGSGRWAHADFSAAKASVDSSGTSGAQVVVGPAMPWQQAQLEYLASVLRDLGYEVSMAPAFDEPPEVFAEWAKGQTQITFNGWAPDYLGPSTYLGLYTCDGQPSGISNYCDAEFDAAYAHALELQATDRAAAGAEWAALDRRGADLALFAPMYNLGGDFISARVGNYSFSPSGYALLDQMWVQ
jgi:peptide/nickel transport system substrate-binding protein